MQHVALEVHWKSKRNKNWASLRRLTEQKSVVEDKNEYKKEKRMHVECRCENVFASSELVVISHECKRNAHLNFKIRMRASATMVHENTLRSSQFNEFWGVWTESWKVWTAWKIMCASSVKIVSLLMVGVLFHQIRRYFFHLCFCTKSVIHKHPIH